MHIVCFSEVGWWVRGLVAWRFGASVGVGRGTEAWRLGGMVSVVILAGAVSNLPFALAVALEFAGMDSDARRARDQWIRRRFRWQAEFPWLSAAWAGKRWGVGCMACYAMVADGTMAKFRCSRFPLMKALLTQHENTAAHNG